MVTYNRTQRKWTCSAVLMPHTETRKQNDRCEKENKERQRRGWDVG